MKREELKNMGLTDEQINQIMQQNGQDIENAKQNAAAEEKRRANELQQKLDAANTDLETMRTKAADADKYKADFEDADSKLKAYEKNDAILEALAEYNPRDAKMILRLLDGSKITRAEDGTITGLKEQIEPMKAASGFLFSDSPAEKGGNPNPGGGGGAFDMNAFLRG